MKESHLKLKDLKDSITDDSSVYLQINDELPFYYSSWKKCKEDLKETAWDEEVRLKSYAGILIEFINK